MSYVTRALNIGNWLLLPSSWLISVPFAILYCILVCNKNSLLDQLAACQYI